MKTRKPNQLPDSLKSIDVKSILRKRGIYLQKHVNQKMKETLIPLAVQVIKGKKHPKIKSVQPTHPTLTDEQVKLYSEKQVHMVEVVEKRFEDKLRQYIGTIEKGFLDHLDQEVKKDYFSDQEDNLVVKAQLDFTPLLNGLASLAGNEAMKLINSNDVYIPFNYKDVIEENVKKFATSLIDTDKEHLTNILNQGLEDGKSVADIRRSITEEFPEYTKNQAQRITRTEVMRTSNQAALDAWEQSGVVEGKQWLIYGATDECAQYDGDVVTLKGSFYDSDSEFQDGDPPLHPNCKCVLLPVLVNEKGFEPSVNKELYVRIKSLENKIDKRTKEFKEIKALRIDDQAYIKALEKYLGNDEPPRED